jgi:hypothetical protein
MMKAAKAPVSEPAVTAAAKEEARPAPVEPEAPPPPPALVPKAAGQPSGEQVAGASTPALLPFPDKGIATLNEMLKEHAGGDVYEIKKAEKVGGQKLWNVVMEVRGLDGRLTKTVEAESLVFWVDKDFLDLEFQVGSVTFHQGAAGRSTKSPFFNDRYTLPVLLKSGGGAGWLATNQPFVRPK